MEPRIYEEMQQLENRHWWFIARRQIISNVLSRCSNNQSLNIFDAGCGNGDNLAMLSGFGKVTAMEKNPVALERARARKVCNVVAGELPDDIPSQLSDKHELVVLLDVLEHIDDDARSLTTLHSLLADEGQILITVPAYPFLWSRHDELHHHKRRYTRQQLQQVLEQNGFDIRFISYFNTFLFPLALVDRVIKKVTANDDVMALPPRWLNQSLLWIFSKEAGLVGRVYLPFGLSLMALAAKKNRSRCS